MLVMFCDLCGDSTPHAEVVRYGVELVDACDRCMKILQIAVLHMDPAESAWMN